MITSKYYQYYPLITSPKKPWGGLHPPKAFSCVGDGCIAPGVAFECKIDHSVSALGFGIIFQLIRKISAINVLELPAVGQFFALGA